ncbi:hypothetical protein J3D49_002078 [Pseudomonas kilonensis]|nr:hypothetical protein [Pseudomonas kilonensis]
MDINIIVSLYKKQEISAQQAFELLQENNLLPEALMQLLVNLHDEREAFNSLSQ